MPMFPHGGDQSYRDGRGETLESGTCLGGGVAAVAVVVVVFWGGGLVCWPSTPRSVRKGSTIHARAGIWVLGGGGLERGFCYQPQQFQSPCAGCVRVQAVVMVEQREVIEVTDVVDVGGAVPTMVMATTIVTCTCPCT